jgi:hypothetical protein
MTYLEKFNASESRAHYQNIGTKILRDMNDLRSKADDSSTAPRRWIWELIQNAKDVHTGNGVDIRVTLESKATGTKVKFLHNGKPFTADNIRFLIEQISTKDRSKDESGKRKNTGKFGTGFLTTHLLSEKVTVKGVAKEPELEYRKFKLDLDRSGHTIEEITEAVAKAKEAVADLDSLPPYTEYNEDSFNTAFIYPLMDEVSKEIAETGLTDLETSLPYALSLVEEINSVDIDHKDWYYSREKDTEYNNDSEIEIKNVSLFDSRELDVIQNFSFAKLSKGFTSILLPISYVDGQITILPIDENVPKLFCDFPLVGTEIFPFPVVINNSNFNPTDPRDGVYLNKPTRPNPEIEENKKIIAEAIELFFTLLEHAASNSWKNLHLLAQINSIGTMPSWISQSWYDNDVLGPIRKKLLYAKIVKTADKNIMASILSADGAEYIWFPTSAKKEIRDKIWSLATQWFPHCLPRLKDVDLWYKLAWNGCGKLTLSQFAEFAEGAKTVSGLFSALKEKVGAVEWLNEFYKLLFMDEKEALSIFEKRLIVPDQNGSFCKKSTLLKDVGDIPKVFKDILTNLGVDIRGQLADGSVELKFESNKEYGKVQIVKAIIAEVTEKTNDREVAKGYRKAFNQLLIYFREFPEEAKSLFPTLVRQKHLLYDDEEILSNISKAEVLEDLYEEFDVKNPAELRSLLEKATAQKQNLLPASQEVLASMGITSIEEWQAALQDKDLRSLFSHTSIPTTEKFIISQSLIARAKKRVIEYLASQEEYDLSEMDDQTARTVLAGIKKNEFPISIVFRPAYDHNVIIFYGSELDILDYEPSELWADDGVEVKQISLGHILRTSGIRKFPI